MKNIIYAAIYIVMLLVEGGLYIYLKVVGKNLEDRVISIEIQNWMIFCMIMLKLISMEV